jgi:hypothetical protein
VTRSPRNFLTLAAAIAAMSLAGAGQAAAKGGVKTPPPPPTEEPADVCAAYWDMPAWPDGSLPIVNRTAGGCVIVRHYLTGVNRLDQVALLPGWTYELKSNGEGTSSRVQVDLTETATGATSSMRVENGKTVGR